MVNWKLIPAAMVITLIIAAIFSYWIGMKEIDVLNFSVNRIQAERDSIEVQLRLSELAVMKWEKEGASYVIHIRGLEILVERLELRTREKQFEIDSLIKIDSVNAIPQYRAALVELGINPDIGKVLTYREIGYGAKFMFETFGLRLQVNYKDSIYQAGLELMRTKNLIIVELKEEVVLTNKLVLLADEEKNAYKIEYEKLTSFWHNRFVVSGGFALFYADKAFGLGPYVGIGIRLY